MNLSVGAIRRPVTTVMGAAALVVLGLIAVRRIPVSLFPDVDFPIVTVTVRYEGADPETVETDVTDVIEEAVNTISGVKTIRSESTEGLAQIFIEFELEVDVDVAAQEVRDKVAAVRGDLPRDIDPPIVEKFDPDSAPILAIVLSGPAGIRALTTFADDVLKPRLEGLRGVGSVRIVGGRKREIWIWLHADDLYRFGIVPQDVVDALQREHIEVPGGRLVSPTREFVVKTDAEATHPSDLGDIVVAYRGFAPVYLRDIATIEDGAEEARSLSRLNGKPAVSLLVRRQSGTNLVQVAERVKEDLDRIRGTILPPGYELTVAQDLSRFVRQSVEESQFELLRAAFLAVAVVLLFLRSVRGAFVVSMTIPTTIIGTYAAMYFFGFSANVMTMLALTICVGMIIDDSIVVLENIYRHMEEGEDRSSAAIRAMGEIGFAVVVTSVAICAVFIPVAFMRGLVGRFFYEFGLTVTFAVVISTTVALTLSPMLCSRVLRYSPAHGRLFVWSERVFSAIERGYARAIALVLRFRYLTLLAALSVFIASLALSRFLGTEFLPDQDENQFNVQVETPQGATLEQTSTIVAEIERRLWKLPYVRTLFTTIGAGMEGRVNVASVLVQLTDRSQRPMSQQEVMELARQRLADLTHLKISVENIPRVSGGGFRAAPIQYNLRGRELPVLVSTAEKIADRMRDVPGIVDVNLTFESGKPELRIEPDWERGRDLGLPASRIGETVRYLIGGAEVARFEEGGERYDIRIRLRRSDRDDPTRAGIVPLRAASGELVQLQQVARIETTTGPVQIDRQDRQRQVTIMANLQKGKPLGEALDDIRRIEREVGLPKGVVGVFTGAGDLMAESFQNINFSLFLAIVLIYMTLAAQFESYLQPLAIMVSLPMSVGGAFVGLLIGGMTLNIFSMIGMIMLMGLVTKNAILLVDVTNQLRRTGKPMDEALCLAGERRLRPILMTALSTMAGMLPVALGTGAGSETRAPLGTCVLGGMVSSTLLTLFVVPALYAVLETWSRRVRTGIAAVFGRKKGQTEQLSPDLAP